MAQFDCSECGKTLGIQQVETHLQKCKSQSVNCMYCACEFFEDDYKDHTECEEKGQSGRKPSLDRGSNYKRENRSDVSHEEYRRRSRSRRSSQSSLALPVKRHSRPSPSPSPPHEIIKVSDDDERLEPDSDRQHRKHKRSRKRRRHEDDSDYDDRRKRKKSRTDHYGRKTATPRRFKRFVKKLIVDGPVSLAELQDAFERKFKDNSDIQDFAKLIMVGEVISSPSVEESASEGYAYEGGFEKLGQEWKPCFNYEKGNCRFGEKCRFLHTSYGRAIEGGGEALMDEPVVGFNNNSFPMGGVAPIVGGVEPPGAIIPNTICTNFQNGHCALGDYCQFIHDVSTQINSYWKLQGGATGQNLTTPHKTKHCFNFQKGFCAYGKKCRYIHDNNAAFTVPTNGTGVVKKAPGFRGKSKKKPCFNFNKGHCKFGEGCRYLHQKGGS